MENSRYAESAALLERSKRVLAGGVSSEFRKFSSPHALFYTHGEGSRLFDVDGNEYLDFSLSQGPLILGHSHPEVLKVINVYSHIWLLFIGRHLLDQDISAQPSLMIVL